MQPSDGSLGRYSKAVGAEGPLVMALAVSAVSVTASRIRGPATRWVPYL